MPGVITVDLDMCRFGFKACDQWGEGLAMKPTRIMTNMSCAPLFLEKKCCGGHRHVALMSGKAKAAARYTDDFCQAMIDCLIQQQKEDKSEKNTEEG